MICLVFYQCMPRIDLVSFHFVLHCLGSLAGIIFWKGPFFLLTLILSADRRPT